MRKTFILGTAVVASLCLATLLARAAPVALTSAIPDPRAWASRVLASASPEVARSFVRNVAFIENLGKKGPPKFRKLKINRFNRLGFLKAVHPRNSYLTFLLNDYEAPDGSDPMEFLATHVRNIRKLTAADVVVYAPPGSNPWSLVAERNGKAQIIGLSSQPKSLTDPEKIFDWLYDVFGYHGVVLAIENEMILVATKFNRFTPNAQALVLENSAGKTVFPAKMHKGAAVIQHLRSNGPYAVFKIVLRKTEGAVKPGSKVLIESQVRGK